jgi:hypothetical protein
MYSITFNVAGIKLTTFQSENFKGKPTAEPNDTAEYKTIMYPKEIRYDGVG